MRVPSEGRQHVGPRAIFTLAHFGLGVERKEYVQDRPGHDRRYLLDSSKIRRELGWRDTVRFEDGFAETVDWYRTNECWWRPLVGKLDINEAAWAGK